MKIFNSKIEIYKSVPRAKLIDPHNPKEQTLLYRLLKNALDKAGSGNKGIQFKVSDTGTSFVYSREQVGRKENDEKKYYLQ